MYFQLENLSVNEVPLQKSLCRIRTPPQALHDTPAIKEVNVLRLCIKIQHIMCMSLKQVMKFYQCRLVMWRATQWDNEINKVAE